MSSKATLSVLHKTWTARTLLRRQLSCRQRAQDRPWAYEFIKGGHRNFAYQTPWFKENGEQGGLIELIVDMPEEYPVFNRDKE